MTRRLYATFVLPAPNGCNLKCPFCIIERRREASQSVLSSEDYLNFFRDLLVHYPINRMGIQGYEPLLPETWPLTKEMLRLAARFFCETSVITNGTYLPGVMRELGGLSDSLTVSLDSADAATHDRLRGVQGAFEQATTGLRMASKTFRGNLCVSSVLFPRRAKYLSGMIELLSSLGISEWVISPEIRLMGRYSTNFEFVRDTILSFTEEGNRAGIRVLFSDEVRLAENIGDLYERLSVRSIADADEIFRLAPDASCSIGREIMGSTEAVQRWDQKTPAHIFVHDLLRNRGRSIQERHLVSKVFLSLIKPKGECYGSDVRRYAYET